VIFQFAHAQSADFKNLLDNLFVLQNTPGAFNQVTIASCAGASVVFCGFVYFARRRGLLSWG
jgi:hypothetical protein